MSLPVKYVLPEDQRESDWTWLGIANRIVAPFNRMNVQVVYEKLKTSKLHLLRLEPPHEGVLLLEVQEQNGHKRLLVWAVAGRGIARIATRLAQLLQETALEWGCEAVQTNVIDPRLAKAIMRSGARPESVTLVLEVEA